MSTDQSIPDLVSTALSQVSRLVQNELRLARKEMAMKATLAGIGLGMVAGSALIAVAALVLLLTALAAWFVVLGLSPPMAHLAAGLLGLVIAGVVGWLGMKRLAPENLVPHETLHQFEQDAAAVKGQVR